jgi:hypothetical protein
MRLTLLAAIALVSPAFGQRNLNPIGTNGNVLHPGIPLTGRPAAGASGRGTALIPGVPTAANRAGGGRIGGRRSFGGAVYIPYPIYGPSYGNSYGSGYGFDGFYSGGYPSVHNPEPGTYDPIFGGYNPGVAYGGAPPAQPMTATPTVIINQNFQTDTIHPQFRDYSNAQLPEPGAVMVPPAAAAAVPPAPPAAPPLADDQPTIFLIAMQDHTIYPVIAYWVQGDTLNYISLKAVPNRVSLALVDRDLSKQLNGERNVPFALPAAR